MRIRTMVVTMLTTWEQRGLDPYEEMHKALSTTKLNTYESQGVDPIPRKSPSEIETFELGRHKVPVAMLGTSPFCGAGQFGGRAAIYYQKFYERPKNMVRLIEKSVELGIPAVQVIPYPRISEAVRDAQNSTGSRIYVVGTIGLENVERELETLIELDAAGIAVHASIADGEPEMAEELLESIRETGAAAGIATHEPWRSVARAKSMRMDFLHAPVNEAGYMMGPNPSETLRKLENFRKPIIAIKPLAAGRSDPEEAFEFLSGRVEGVAVGITSEEEMEETWGALRKKFTSRTNEG